MSESTPAGSCDAHVHVFGPEQRFPVRDRSRPVQVTATVDACEAIHARIGVERAIAVQPGAYQGDPSCLLDALTRMKGRWKGIVLPNDVLHAEQWETVRAAGVVGVRLNFVDDSEGALIDLRRLEPLLYESGGHLEALIRLDALHALRDEIARVRIPFVVDHMGYTRAKEAISHAGLESLTMLMRDGPVWTKLSGIDRIGHREARYQDAQQLAMTIVAANRERVVWGSDWPHLRRTVVPHEGELLHMFTSWFDETTDLLRTILVDNPSALYGFS